MCIRDSVDRGNKRAFVKCLIFSGSEVGRWITFICRLAEVEGRDKKRLLSTTLCWRYTHTYWSTVVFHIGPKKWLLEVSLHQEEKEKTAFSTPSGLFQFNIMSFGLWNAPAAFERLMDLVLPGLTWKTCLVYLDDVIVLSLIHI